MIRFQIHKIKISHPANEYTLILERVNADNTIDEVAYFKTSEKPTAELVVTFLNSMANWGMTNLGLPR